MCKGGCPRRFETPERRHKSEDVLVAGLLWRFPNEAYYCCVLCCKVSKEEGLALAREFSCPFFETSAAFRYFIDDVFHAVVREIRRKEKEAVMAVGKKSRPQTSVWKRLKSPFRKKKKNSVTWDPLAVFPPKNSGPSQWTKAVRQPLNLGRIAADCINLNIFVAVFLKQTWKDVSLWENLCWFGSPKDTTCFKWHWLPFLLEMAWQKVLCPDLLQGSFANEVQKYAISLAAQVCLLRCWAAWPVRLMLISARHEEC